MYKWKLLGKLTMLILISCTACQKEKYVYQLSDQQLESIIIDIHASEGMVKNFEITLRDSISRVYYDQIMDIHEVEEPIFKKDFEMLKRNPEKLEELYKKIEKELEQRKSATFEDKGSKKIKR